MEGIKHFIVALCFCIGMFAGMVLIDFDHSGSLKDKLRNFFKVDDEHPVLKGWLHDKVVMLSLSVFLLGAGLGLLIHYVMDFI